MKSLNLTYLLLIQDFPQDNFRIKCCLSVSILNYNSSKTLHVNNYIQSKCLHNLDYICIGHIVVCYTITFIFISCIAWKRQNKKITYSNKSAKVHETSSSSECSEDTLALNLDLCILKLHTKSLSMHSYNFMHTFMLLQQASGNLCITTNSHA